MVADVTVDVSSPTFAPGKKAYDRLKWSLSTRLDRTESFIVTCASSSGLDNIRVQSFL